MMLAKAANVPCDGCVMCCHGEAILLHPEKGDDVRDYQTIIVDHPVHRGTKAFMIKPNENGTTTCRYLGPTGCSIYSKRPVICREFDCRRFAEKVTPALEAVLRKRDKDGQWEKLRNRGRELIAKGTP